MGVVMMRVQKVRELTRKRRNGIAISTFHLLFTRMNCASLALVTYFIVRQLMTPSAQDKKKFQEVLKEAQRGDDVAALAQLGNFYFNGIGTSQDWVKALEWYTKVF